MRLVLAGQKSFGAAVLERLWLDTVLVVSPDRGDRLAIAARNYRIPCQPYLDVASLMGLDVDLIVCAHSHNFISRPVRQATVHGAIGYHPSLLPLHRGRSAVEWAVRDRDRISGGSVYWLDDGVDTGPVAKQDWCFVDPGWSASDLWRERLFPLGVDMLEETVLDIGQGNFVQVPQVERFATFEPAMDPPRLYRPDLPQLPPIGGWAGTVRVGRDDAKRR